MNDNAKKIVYSWWNSLEQHDRDLLVEFLYSEVNLTEYFDMDDNGNLLKRRRD